MKEFFYRWMIKVLIALAGTPREQAEGSPRRFLIIRRNHIGDMICTLPLLKSLRLQYPEAEIDVACDEDGALIAKASGVVNRVITLRKKKNSWLAAFIDAKALQNYDVAIAVKAGFDHRLAFLTRLTKAPVRIGFEKGQNRRHSLFYTDAVASPVTAENQIDSCLRLLRPLKVENLSLDLSLNLPTSSLDFAEKVLKEDQRPHARFIIINISSHRPIKWPLEKFMELAEFFVSRTGGEVAISSVPADHEKALDLVKKLNSSSIFALKTSTIFDLGAVLKKALFIFTPEGGVTHLAAALKKPALIFFSGGHFTKWNTRLPYHHYIRADLSKKPITVEEVWQIVENKFLAAQQK